MANRKKYENPVHKRIAFDKEDSEWMDEYCFANSMSVTSFINDAVKEKITKIETELKLKNQKLCFTS